MIDPTTARKYRDQAEQEAREAVARGDYDVWLRAIGRVSAVDYTLADEEERESAGERIPFCFPKLGSAIRG